MKYLKYLIFLFAAAISLLAVLPLFHSGFFPMHDDTQIGRVVEMTRALRDGEFPVRWVRDLGYGYGYPLFNFYGPFPYYIGSFFVLIGLNVLTATKIMMGIPIILSGICMFWFVSEFFGKIPAAIASVLYVFFPYHAVNLYVRGDIGELYAYVFLPVILLAFFKLYYLAQQDKKMPVKWIVVLSVSFALLVISHNLSAFMMALMLMPLFIGGVIFSPGRLKFAMWVVGGMILAFLLSAFYAIPVVAEMKYTNVLSQIGGGSYFADHFVCPSQLWNSPWGFGGSVKGCIDGFSFKLGKSTVIFAGISLLVFLYALFRRERSYMFLILSIYFILVLSIFLLLSQSIFIWKHVPDMDFLQFPWRFLNFVGLSLSVVVAVGVYLFHKTFFITNRVIILLAIIIFAITLFFNAKLFAPQSFIQHPLSYYTSESYLKWYVSSLSDEYLPKNFKKISSKNDVVKFPLEIISGNGVISNFVHTTNLLRANLSLSQSSPVHIYIAYFPAWKFKVDNHPVNFSIQHDGIQVLIPKGNHVIEAQYQKTTIENIADIISLVGVIIVVGLFLQLQYKRVYDKTS